MYADGIAERIHTSIPDMFNQLFRGNNPAWMEQKIFQKAAFFTGKGQWDIIYRCAPRFGIKSKISIIQANILLNKFAAGKAAERRNCLSFSFFVDGKAVVYYNDL